MAASGRLALLGNASGCYAYSVWFEWDAANARVRV